MAHVLVYRLISYFDSVALRISFSFGIVDSCKDSCKDLSLNFRIALLYYIVWRFI